MGGAPVIKIDTNKANKARVRPTLSPAHVLRDRGRTLLGRTRKGREEGRGERAAEETQGVHWRGGHGERRRGKGSAEDAGTTVPAIPLGTPGPQHTPLPSALRAS